MIDLLSVLDGVAAEQLRELREQAAGYPELRRRIEAFIERLPEQKHNEIRKILLPEVVSQ